MIIKTIEDTLWNQDGKGNFIIPKGTEAHVLGGDQFKNMPRSDEKIAIGRANKMYKDRGVIGVWAFLENKWRYLEKNSFKRMS